MTRTFVLAQCTSSKRDAAAPARDLYDASRYFRAQRAYAQTQDRWAIQSAKHGLVWPDRDIHPYDKTPDEIDDTDYWAYSIADEIEYELSTEWVVELLGGRAYTDPLTPELEQRGFEVHEPLRGLRYQPRINRLKELAAEYE